MNGESGPPYLSLVCDILPLLFWGILHPFLFLARLSWRHVEPCLCSSIEVVTWFLSLRAFMWHVYWFVDAERILQSEDDVYLVVMHGCLNMFLNMVCKCFVRNFYTCAHQGNWSVVFFFLFFLLCLVLFVYQNNTAFLFCGTLRKVLVLDIP